MMMCSHSSWQTRRRGEERSTRLARRASRIRQCLKAGHLALPNDSPPFEKIEEAKGRKRQRLLQQTCRGSWTNQERARHVGEQAHEHG